MGRIRQLAWSNPRRSSNTPCNLNLDTKGGHVATDKAEGVLTTRGRCIRAF
jgi:hypothetical protein